MSALVKNLEEERRERPSQSRHRRSTNPKKETNKPKTEFLFQDGWDVIPLMLGFFLGLCLGHSIKFLWRLYRASRLVLQDPTLLLPLIQRWTDPYLTAPTPP